MPPDRLYDIFITHAWRYHEDWTAAAEALDAVPGLKWRNFSVPWHDPAMSPNTEVGGKFIRNWLESQIVPVHAVLLLSGVYAVASNRRWLELELQFARAHRKPVIAIPAVGQTDVGPDVRALCDVTVAWNGGDIVRAIAGVLGNA
jgi:hypothetical protein